ncbi:hypothetical protein [Sciscionella marina]|uniref:hypothetical protein n=1 Tax=Sciscionella marina TaxID=508770 RepID=UPI00035D4067|nr:hypothetical protein [Sciscionella marina]
MAHLDSRDEFGLGAHFHLAAEPHDRQGVGWIVFAIIIVPPYYETASRVVAENGRSEALEGQSHSFFAVEDALFDVAAVSTKSH